MKTLRAALVYPRSYHSCTRMAAATIFSIAAAMVPTRRRLGRGKRPIARMALSVFHCVACTAAWLASPAWAATPLPPAVSVVVGPAADDLERYAADQLCSYLNALYGCTIQPQTEWTASTDTCLLVGNPASHPLIRRTVENDWPKVSDQGIVLKRAQLDGKRVLVVGGGSARASLWAVYHLVERWGVRYLLSGDVLPETAAPFRLPDEDIVLEPQLRIRQWRVVNALACGPESWGMADYRPVLDQLAKLRFNRILVQLWSWQPFVDYQAGGIKRRSATLFFGHTFPITPDMPGRFLFGQASQFWNADLPLNASYEDLSAAGRRLVQNLMSHARRRGMQCVINVNLDEFPPEFAPLLKGAQTGQQLGKLTVVPGSGTSISDPALNELAVAVLRSTINTYPEADYLTLGVKEHRQWIDRYETDWKALDAKYGTEQARSLADIIAAAGRRSGYPGGVERALQEVKGDIVSLRYYDRLFNDMKVLQGTRRPDVRLIYNGFAEELFPVMSRVVAAGSETLNFVDYTPSRILQRKEVLQNIGDSHLPSTLIYTLHDDNVGLLPQLATTSLHALTQELRRCGWAGFSTRYWLISDHDPCVAYLAQAAWDATATPETTYRDQVTAVCGPACIDDMLKLFGEVEAATLVLEQHGLGLTFPVPGMIMQQWKPAAMPAKLMEVREHYRRALDGARQAQRKATPRGQAYAAYWVGRLEFGIGYLNTIEALRRAATADSRMDGAGAVRETETALAEAARALDGYARVARNQSDRGAIATMGEFVYRPLKAQAGKLRAQYQEKSR